MSSLACALVLVAAPAFERSIEAAGPGRVAVALDREVYEAARADLGDLRVVDDAGAAIPYWLERTGPEQSLRSAFTRAEDGQRKETLLSLDLGARHQPFVGLVLDVEDERFSRGVVVEARHETLPRGSGPPLVAWVRLGEETIHRSSDGSRTAETLRLGIEGRERALRIRVRNRDDRPLAIRGVTVIAPVERVVFEAAAGRQYRLTYGAEELQAPDYDLARTLRDPAAWAAAASAARLGRPVRRASPPGSEPPWTERHPRLLWAGLSVVVLALGGLTWRALRAARRLG